MGPAGQKKSALQKIMFKYLCFWGGDFYSPPIEVLAIKAKTPWFIVGLTDNFTSRANDVWGIRKRA